MLYVPVLHEGYIRLFERLGPTVDGLYIPGQSLIDELSFQHREIRAMDPELIARLIRSLGLFPWVKIIETSHIPNLTDHTIVTVDEGFSRRLVESHFPNIPATYESVFLRWDEQNVLSQEPAGYDRISHTQADAKMMDLAEKQAGASGDWWRQVGAVLVRDGTIPLTGHNQHVPSQVSPYAEGDPRDVIQAGTNPEIATTLHAEQVIITEAARRGVALQGADLYVTVFPCPMCAKQLAYAGIKRIFFRGGHASLDGQRILHDRGVELILVPTPPSTGKK